MDSRGEKNTALGHEERAGGVHLSSPFAVMSKSMFLKRWVTGGSFAVLPFHIPPSSPLRITGLTEVASAGQMVLLSGE